jgi:hypothetical protein
MTRKVFTYEPVADSETPEFELAGEVFYCQPTDEVSSLDVLDYIAGLTGDSGLTRIQTMIRLFNAFIPEGDTDRFRKTIRDKKVPLPVLSDIASWTLDEYLNFPTRAAEQSSNGSPPAAPPNGDASTPPPDETSTS